MTDYDGPDRRTDKNEQNIEKLELLINNKQDKIKPWAWIPLAIWIVTTTFGGSWWASATSQQILFLTKIVQDNTDDRYRRTDAVGDIKQIMAEFTQRDQRMDFIDREIVENRTSLQQIQLDIEVIKSQQKNTASP